MRRYGTLLILFLAAGTSFGQLQPGERTLRKVADPSMVVNDRGSLLEVLPTERATPSSSKSGRRVVYQRVAKDASAVISPRQLGVVFNHAMQVYGYTTGEIVFKFRGDAQAPDSFDAASYPGFRKLTNPNVYVIAARTPMEFVQLVKKLQARTDLDWVEPMVRYGESGFVPQ